MAGRLIILIDINIQGELEVEIFTLELGELYHKLLFGCVVLFFYFHCRVPMTKIPLVKEPTKVFTTYLLPGKAQLMGFPCTIFMSLEIVGNSLEECRIAEIATEHMQNSPSLVIGNRIEHIIGEEVVKAH